MPEPPGTVLEQHFLRVELIGVSVHMFQWQHEATQPKAFLEQIDMPPHFRFLGVEAAFLFDFPTPDRSFPPKWRIPEPREQDDDE